MMSNIIRQYHYNMDNFLKVYESDLQELGFNYGQIELILKCYRRSHKKYKQNDIVLASNQISRKEYLNDLDTIYSKKVVELYDIEEELKNMILVDTCDKDDISMLENIAEKLRKECNVMKEELGY